MSTEINAEIMEFRFCSGGVERRMSGTYPAVINYAKLLASVGELDVIYLDGNAQSPITREQLLRW